MFSPTAAYILPDWGEINIDKNFLLAAVVTAAVIFVNGWTDAPNAVATAIASGAIKKRPAIALSAIFNLLGALVSFAFGGAVAENLRSSLSFGENGTGALCSAMISIVIFAVAAWYFGIPTSESHALLAALAGSAAAGAGSAGTDPLFWKTAAGGFLFTTAAGFLLGFFGIRLLDRTRGEKYIFRRCERLSAAALSFIHGAQDGQKFTAVLLSAAAAAGIKASVPLFAAFSAALMAAGTAAGGGRIIKRVGTGITDIDDRGSIACDAAAGISLFLCTAFGMPASTTHTKTTAVLGVGAARKKVDLRSFFGIFAAWVLTFPCCFAISFVLTKFCAGR